RARELELGKCVVEQRHRVPEERAISRRTLAISPSAIRNSNRGEIRIRAHPGLIHQGTTMTGTLRSIPRTTARATRFGEHAGARRVRNRLELGIDAATGRSAGPREASRGVFAGPGRSPLTRPPIAAASDLSASASPT